MRWDSGAAGEDWAAFQDWAVSPDAAAFQDRAGLEHRVAFENRAGYEDLDGLDLDAGPVVRPYTMTGGRVRPAVGAFDLVAFVVAVPLDRPPPEHLQPEHRAILAAAAGPISVAELAARLDLALGVVRVLLGDLVAEDLIYVQQPQAAAGPPDENILKAVVNGLRAL